MVLVHVVGELEAYIRGAVHEGKGEMKALIAALMILPMAAFAGGRPGDFDYYVLSLSWSPNWCEIEGRARRSEQCDRDHGWVLHGLWPQYDDGGYPSDCQSGQRPPSRSDTRAQAGLFGSSGSAWHQWNKHGSCTGLSPRNFYRLSQEAYDRVTRPAVLRQLDKRVTLPARLIEEAFLRENPDLTADGLTVTCKDGGIQEVRICLTRDLEPRECGRDVRRDCSLSNAWLEPID